MEVKKKGKIDLANYLYYDIVTILRDRKYCHTSPKFDYAFGREFIKRRWKQILKMLSYSQQTLIQTLAQIFLS
jgi:hypothetical protein